MTEKQKQSRREINRRWYEKNKAYVNARSLKWQAENRDWHASYVRTPNGRFRSAKSIAKRRGYEFEIPLEVYADIIKDGKCHYCGKPLNPTGGGLDRKDNEPYYRAENVVPCCWRCNTVFMDEFDYKEKLILAEAIKEIDARRATCISKT